MCLAGIEAELKALIARKQAAEAAEIKAKATMVRPKPQSRPIASTSADKTIPTFRRLPAT